MAIKETFVVATDGVERGLKKVEGLVEASAVKQSAAVKGAAAKSTREVIAEYEKGAKAAGKAGATAADELLKELRNSLNLRRGQIKEAFSRGAFDRATMRQMNQDARREMDKGILKAMDDMQKKGHVNRDEYNKLARALQAVGPAAKAGLQPAEQGLGRIRTTIQGLITSTRAWIAGFVGIQAIRLATRLVGDLTTQTTKLDAALTNSLAIMEGVTQSMRQEMDQQSRVLSRRLSRDADLVAEGYRFLAAAGLNAEKSLASIGTVSVFATAGSFNLARATDLLTDAQSALGLAVDDTNENLVNMTRIGDVLTKANTIANASVEQFSEALTNRAAPALRMVNKDVEEGVAILAAMADQGVKGAEAGTRLDIVLRDLQKSALNNSDTFARFGVGVFDSNGKLRNMADIIGDLETLLDGMSDAQKRATITTMGFQDRSVASLLTLMGTSDKIREYERELRSAAGTMQSVADKQMASIEARWGRIGQAWTEAKRRAGELIVLPVAEWVMGVADAMLQLDDPFDRAIDKLQRFGAGAEAVLATQLTARIGKLRDEARELERDIASSTLVTATEQIAGERGTMTVERTAQIGTMAPVDVLRLRHDLQQRLEAQQTRLNKAIVEQNEAEQRGAQVMVDRITGQLETIDALAAKREDLRITTNQLLDAEEALAEVQPKLELRRQVQAIDREIAELNARGEESAGTIQVLLQLEAEKQKLLKELAGGTDAPGAEGGFAPTEEEIKAGEAAAKALAASMRELQLADALGLESLKDASSEVRTALRDLLSISEQVEAAEAQVAAIRAAGQVVPAGAQAYLDHLREIQAELRQFAGREIERWQRDLPGAVAVIGHTINDVFSIMLQMEGGTRSLDTAMSGVVARTKAIATAERELQRAQMARDPARIARAEKDLAAAREELAAFTARLTVALEAAGLPAEELAKIIERIQQFLGTAGVETKKVEGRFAGLGKQAQMIAGLARGVLSVADAMGVLDDQTRRALDASVNLADGISRIATSGGMDVGAWAQSIGSAIQLGAALFGSDPEAKRRAEEMQRSMDRLTDALWELGKTIVSESTRQLERDRDAAQRGLDSLSATDPSTVFFRRKTTLAQTAVDMGLISAEDAQQDRQAAIDALRQWATEMDSRYGTSLAGFVEDENVRGLQAALEKTLPAISDQLGKLGGFGDDPAGIIARVNFQLDILGETDAAERLRAVVEALKAAGHEAGEFQAALDELAALDLDTPEGRARRDVLVQGMADALARGGADLGELTADQLQDLIRGWAGVSAEPGVTRGVQIGTSITEVQANEVIAWLEDIAITIREIRDGKGAGSLSPAADPGSELASSILDELRSQLSQVAAMAQTITPEVIEAAITNHYDFRGAQFGRIDEHDLDEQLRELRALILQRNRRAF